MEYKVQESCRICGGSLKNVLKLGDIYPSNFVDKTEGKAVPLTLVECKLCGLVQLKYTVSLDSMYRNYFYQSGINPSMVDSLQDVVTDIENTVTINNDDILIDIGCNDGTMFTLYKNKFAIKVGFDPALNLADKAKENCDFFINDYFQNCNYPNVLGKAKVITAIAMFYDLPNPNEFMECVNKLLVDDGIFVIQFTDLISMLKINAFDNICHEHLEYYKLEDIVNLLAKYGLTVFKVSYNTVNGGSIRVFACRNSTFPIEESVLNSLMVERSYLTSYNNDPMKEFSTRVADIKNTVINFLIRCQDAGLVVYGMGASTKGNTLLQYFGIRTGLIRKIAEVNKDKFGKFTIKTNIPIVSEDEALSEYPDMFFLLPWHFLDDFIKRNIKFLEDGGAFVVPLPEPRLYYMEKGEVKWTLLEKVLA